MNKKLICCLLAVVMVLGAVPFSALAADSTAFWPNFRNGDANMAIVDLPTPNSAATTVLKWAKSFGTGYSNSPSGQIIADNSLIFMNMTSLKKVDLQTGELLKETAMAASGGYVTISPTYGNGMVFCPLTGGKIQAFDAKTLEAKWTFADALGGQNNTPITYANGYLYTGYWNSEVKDANYVCVNASTGELVWSKTVPGGFYWAGSVIVGNAVIVGSDDGANGYTGNAHLFALNKTTGDVISDITLTGMGDQRSTIAYSAEKGRVYFTTKGGYIASAAVNASTGALSDLKSSKVAAQSTTTPVVYGNKVFFAAGSGVVQGSNGAGNFIVADADTLEGLYAIPLLGYPQGSTMASTAYLKKTGKLYFYCTYNGKPGGMTLITLDPNDNTGKSAKSEEVYDAAGYEAFCLISPICGPDGTIYYRNDSGTVFALTTNEAYLAFLTAGVGKLNSEFASNKMNYELVVPAGTASVTFTAAACEGGTVTLNGGDASASVALTDGTGTAAFEVTKGADSRTYTVTVREESADATLSALNLNESNTFASFKTLTPAFSAEESYYGFYNVGSSRSFENIWPVVNDANAKVVVTALENVKTGKFDAQTGAIAITATTGGHDRYGVYFEDAAKPTAIRVDVTAENGTDTATYYLVMSKASVQGGEELLQSYKDQDAAKAVEKLIDGIDTDSPETVTAAWEAYDALTADQKALVTNYDALTAAEAAVDKAAAEVKATEDAIDAIGTVTENSGEAIQAARSAYDALSDARKAKVGNYETLTAAEAALAKLEADNADKAAAEAVNAKIGTIGTVTKNSGKAIQAARSAYDALTGAQKALVSKYGDLLDAEKTYAQLTADADPAPEKKPAVKPAPQEGNKQQEENKEEGKQPEETKPIEKDVAVPTEPEETAETLPVLPDVEPEKGGSPIVMAVAALAAAGLATAVALLFKARKKK